MKFFAAFLLSLSLLPAAELPAAEGLLQKSLERSGGKAYAGVKSMRVTGTVDMVGHNIRGPVSIFQTETKSYTAIELAGLGKVEEGFDGDTAWEMNALQGARIKDGEEKAAMERAEHMAMLSSWHDYYTSARTVGSEDVGGKAAWKIELTPKIGKPEFFYLDKTTGLLSRIQQNVATALGEIEVDSAFGDYRPIQGIQTPFTITQNAMGQAMKMTFDKVQYNVEIPAATFTLPPAVKAILDKRKTEPR